MDVCLEYLEILPKIIAVSNKCRIFAHENEPFNKSVAWIQEIIELLGTMGYVKRLKTSSRQKHAKNLIAILLENKKVAENQPLSLLSDFVLCRDEATRTPDPYVPNVVRYQLRYIPMRFPAKSAAKLL